MNKYVQINSWQTPEHKTVNDLINKEYPDFKIKFEDEAGVLNADITHGYEVEYHDNRKHGLGETLVIYPFIKWSDGGFAPVHYWGGKHQIHLFR